MSELSSHLEALCQLLAGKRSLVLSGAGLSTESGIPDYRGPQPDGSPKPPRQPMRYQQFIATEAARQRYWARSSVGWLTIHHARPNAGHYALTALERSGLVHAIITQNVDGLQQRAGATQVLELHGSLHRVRCLVCGSLESRDNLQHRLLRLNPEMEQHYTIAPDGDAEIDERRIQQFEVASCLHCQGTLKPDVVFFGENVPPARTQAAWAHYQHSDAVLVVGSSLTVYSGYRFVRQAHQDGKPVAIINDGKTRADELATLRLAARLGSVLPQLAHMLTGT